MCPTTQAAEIAGPLNDGWGLTTDGKLLIATDSSSVVHFIDPVRMKVRWGIAGTGGAAGCYPVSHVPASAYVPCTASSGHGAPPLHLPPVLACLQVVRSMPVTDGGHPVKWLNEVRVRSDEAPLWAAPGPVAHSTLQQRRHQPPQQHCQLGVARGARNWRPCGVHMLPCPCLLLFLVGADQRGAVG